MTFETGSATDLEDLLSKLDTFAVTTHGGWTRGYTSNPQTTDGWFEVHKGNLSVSAKYPVGAQGPPENMSLHQATGFVGTGTAPGAHTADSGNGYNAGTTGHTNANLFGERCVGEIGNGPFPSYYFFADDATDDYIHVVVQPVSGMFRHFGFGKFVQFGNNWVGGEYLYGHKQEASVSATAIDTRSDCFFDGVTSPGNDLRSATIRIASGLLNQSPAVWAVSYGSTTGINNDTAGNVRRRIHGGFRMGIEARGFGNQIGNQSSGVIPMYSIAAYYRDPLNPRVQLLGFLPDVRGLNIRNFEAGEEVTVGVDTWVVFPWSIKTLASVAYRSRYSGVAYKKVV